jgi:hypothetical protein
MGYRARRLVTFVSGLDDFGDVLVVFFFSLCYGRSTFGVVLGREIRDFDVDSFHLQASPRVRRYSPTKKGFIVQVLWMNGFRPNFHAFCFFEPAAALIFGREIISG